MKKPGRSRAFHASCFIGRNRKFNATAVTRAMMPGAKRVAKPGWMNTCDGPLVGLSNVMTESSRKGEEAINTTAPESAMTRASMTCFG
jgi:hypothetical protein